MCERTCVSVRVGVSVRVSVRVSVHVCGGTEGMGKKKEKEEKADVN